MTNPKRLRVALTLPIDPPHPFIAHNEGNPEVLATEALWERDATEGGDDHTRVVVFAKSGQNRSYYPHAEQIPDWVPQPAASWYAIVSDLGCRGAVMTAPAA